MVLCSAVSSGIECPSSLRRSKCTSGRLARNASGTANSSASESRRRSRSSAGTVKSTDTWRRTCSWLSIVSVSTRRWRHAACRRSSWSAASAMSPARSSISSPGHAAMRRIVSEVEDDLDVVGLLLDGLLELLERDAPGDHPLEP